MQKLSPYPPRSNEGLPGAEGAVHVASGEKEHRAALEAEAWQIADAGSASSLPLHCGLECFLIGESSGLEASNVIKGMDQTLTLTCTLIPIYTYSAHTHLTGV